MKRYITLLLCLCALPAMAQLNLVPNPSFELYNNCPTTSGQIPYSNNYTGFQTVQAWSNPLQSSPDYFNTCAPTAPSQAVGVPGNYYGFQNPRTGNAYIGLVAYAGDTAAPPYVSDHVYCRLIQPLNAGVTYNIRFFVSATFPPTGRLFATDRIGVHFSDTIAFNATNDKALVLPFHVRNPVGVLLDDTENWTEVRGSYVANGGEQYLFLGNFADPTEPINFKQISGNPSGSSSRLSYYYIDDVSVSDSLICDTFNAGYDSSLCGVTSIVLTSAKDSAVNYSWNNGQPGRSITVSMPGTYWCYATTDSCDVYIDSFTVGEGASTFRNVIDTALCQRNPQLSLSSSAANAQSYLWNTGDSSQSITVTTPGTYSCYTVLDTCHIYIDTFRVTIGEDTLRNNFETIICQHDNVDVLLLSSATNADSYSWSTGSDISQIIVTEPDTYSCTAIKDCEVYIETFYILPTAFIDSLSLGDDTLLCEGVLYALGQTVEYETARFAWSTGDTSCCIEVAAPGDYVLNVTDGCTKLSDTVSISYYDCTQCIWAPTAFSPNRDGLNDFFTPHSLCPLDEYQLIIVNRWGQEVFNATNIQQGWDGKQKGFEAQVGIYFYFIKYRSVVDNEERYYKGEVTLVR